MAKRSSKTPRSKRNRAPIVSAVHHPSMAAPALLEASLKAADFWDHLHASLVKSERSVEDFRILIKPDMGYFSASSALGTDPMLVEHLIDLLAAKGFSQVTVADGLDEADMWLDNREVMILADLVGYHFVTPTGHSYDILNLSEDLAEAPFPAGNTLANSQLSTHWLEADFRINFAKNKTDEANGFALGLQNLMHILPLRARHYHYHLRLRPEEVASSLLRYAPADFTIIDAYQSNHGSQGSRHNNPIDTRTFIASSDVLLADWVGALKMGFDPYTASINAHALRTIGLPRGYRITGDLQPYPGWKNPAPLLRESTQLRNSNAALYKLTRPWLQTIDTELFPFKNVFDEQVNGFLTPMLKDIDDHPLVYWITVGLNYGLSNLSRLQESWQILFDKDRLYRKELDLGFDPSTFKAREFTSIDDYILPLRQIVQHSPSDHNGLQWRYLDGSVVFIFKRILPITYKEFVSKVDIAQAVQMMYDNIGGARLPLRRDSKGRIIEQAERDVYLPQPNWMVLFGGDYIDVGKIERLRYTQNQQQIFWRTVTSANQSATYDDGMVTFKRVAGGTLVEIVARQEFALPTFWKLVNMDYFPEMKDTLVSDAYVRFFTRTMANFEAVCEGRDPRLGQQWNQEYGQDGDLKPPIEIEQLKNIFGLVSGFVKKWSNKSEATPLQPTDESGYRHFKPSHSSKQNAVRSFFGDLSDAIQKDMRLLRSGTQNDKT